uniref:Ig-like domain-containing protein n=1 Tax=Haplochromis burtoni TaxID=8153 RepID=A0A3Q3CB50_HAPBU
VQVVGRLHVISSTLWLYGFMTYRLSRCDFNSTELKDIRFTDSYYYNMIEIIRFDSNVGTFVGFTDFGVKTAEAWNNIPARLATMRAQKGTYCKPNIDVRYHNLMSKSGEPPPTVKLHSTTPLSSHHPAMLVCSVYDFFPSKIKVSWHRDGQEVTSDVTSTEEMEDGDWYYQTHCYLEYTPRSGEKISCVVEHAMVQIFFCGVYLRHLKGRENIVRHKPVRGAKKVGDRCRRDFWIGACHPSGLASALKR